MSVYPHVKANFANKFFRIKLSRSVIGLPEKTRLHVRTLGLRKVGDIVFTPIQPSTVGCIVRVKELIQLSVVDQIPKEKYPQFPKGYKVVGSMLQSS